MSGRNYGQPKFTALPSAFSKVLAVSMINAAYKARCQKSAMGDGRLLQGSGGGVPSIKNFVFFSAKNSLILGLH